MYIPSLSTHVFWKHFCFVDIFWRGREIVASTLCGPCGILLRKAKKVLKSSSAFWTRCDHILGPHGTKTGWTNYNEISPGSTLWGLSSLSMLFLWCNAFVPLVCALTENCSLKTTACMHIPVLLTFLCCCTEMLFFRKCLMFFLPDCYFRQGTMLLEE